MKFLILAIVFALAAPVSVNAASECNDRNVFGAKVDGRCVYFSKGDSPNICTADNPNGYGVQTFSCPEEFLRAYEEKVSAEQVATEAEREEAERQADEELDEKIREAVEDQLKKQEQVRNDQSLPTQTPAAVVPTISPQPMNPVVPAEITTKTPPASIPVTGVQEESLDNPTVSESPPLDEVRSTEKKPSLWAHFSGFLSRLNPFSWFK